jgi:hypothetical protein
MKRRLGFSVTGLLFIFHQAANACPSCYGDESSAEVQGMKWAIVALLGVTGTVLVGISALFLYLRKQAIAFNQRFSDRLN